MDNKKTFKFKLETDPLTHLFSIASSVIFSYFLYPINLSSVGSISILIIVSFISVNFASNFLRYYKG